jgi:pilus assembly protein TadC
VLPSAWLAAVLAAAAFVVAAPIGVRSRVVRLHANAQRHVELMTAASGDRSPGGRGSARQASVAGQIPAALDLLAACLSAGAAPTQAMAAVGRCFDGEVGGVLSSVASLSALGASPEVAWSTAIEANGHERWTPVARAIIRAHHSGAALTEVLVHLADDRRRWLRSTARSAAERAGVKAVLPLGLCFLPAFVLVGVVPVVAGFARTLWQ